MVGKQLFFWNVPFSGEMLIFMGVFARLFCFLGMGGLLQNRRNYYLFVWLPATPLIPKRVFGTPVFFSKKRGSNIPGMIPFLEKKTILETNTFLGGGFKYIFCSSLSQIGNLPQIGMKIKKYLKPPPRKMVTFQWARCFPESPAWL